MSLKRDEWIEMWESIKRIELVHSKCECLQCIRRKDDIKNIKDKIQQVIGRME